jgi:5-formyltetrahydrofolate cyclo-ligase
MSIQSSKQQLRHSFRLRRQQLTPWEQQQKARQLMRIICRCPEFIYSQRIAAYWPNDGEISSIPILQKAHELGKKCYLPVLSPKDRSQLSFVEYKPADLLIPNPLGILEPTQDCKKSIPPWALHLVLTPLVAFDTHGKRLGMGKGYYDKTFSFLKNGSRPRRPILLGLAYELQRVKELPNSPGDIQLDGIVTEQRYLLAS